MGPDGLSPDLVMRRFLLAVFGLAASIVILASILFPGDFESEPNPKANPLRWDHVPAQSEVPSDIKMIPIEVGSFEMGMSGLDAHRLFDSHPAREVTLTKSYELSSTEVTRGQWARVIGDSEDLAFCPQCPIEGITWYEALIFTNVLSRMAGLTPCYLPEKSLLEEEKLGESEDSGFLNHFFGFGRRSGGVTWVDGCTGYRLPTEAEWEYAALAGDSRHFPGGDPSSWGCDEDPAIEPFAWYCANSGGKPRPVATKRPNRWGLYDMHGNVWEWVWDGYEAYSSDSTMDPRGSEDTKQRVDRGGAFDSPISDCSARTRGQMAPRLQDWIQGFRLARSLD